MAVADELISGAASIAGTLFNINSQEKANAANERIAAEQRAWSERMMDKQNAYNDPSAVMQRLARAGLNPNLMYGDGASGVAASADPTPYQSARMVAPQVDPMQLAQIANLNADTEKKKSESALNDVNIDVQRGQIEIGKSVVVYNKALTEMTKSQKDQIVAQCKMLDKNLEVANSQIALNQAQIVNLSEQRKIQWAEQALHSKEVDAIVEKYAAETGYTKEQCRLYAALTMAKVYNLRMDTQLKDMEKGLTEEQTREVHQGVANMRIQNAQMRLNYNLDAKFGVFERQLKLDNMAAECCGNPFKLLKTYAHSVSYHLFGEKYPYE